jgi:hypothetical protein
LYEREIGALDHPTAASEKTLGGANWCIGSDAPELIVEGERPFTLHAMVGYSYQDDENAILLPNTAVKRGI